MGCRRIIAIMFVASFLAASQLQAISTLASICRFANNHRKLAMAAVGLAAWGVYSYKKGFFPFARKAAVPTVTLPENNEIRQKVRGRSFSLDSSVFPVPSTMHALSSEAPQPSTQIDDLTSTRMGGVLVGRIYNKKADNVVVVENGDLTHSQLQLVTPPVRIQAMQAVGNGLTEIAHIAANAAQAVQRGADEIVQIVRGRRNSDPGLRDNALSASFVDIGSSHHAHLPVPASEKIS